MDGALSQGCFFRALEAVYGSYADKQDKQGQQCPQGQQGQRGKRDAARAPFTVAGSDFLVFHSPYHKLVAKAVGRLLLVDARRHPASAPPALAKWLAAPPEATYEDKALEATLKTLTE